MQGKTNPMVENKTPTVEEATPKKAIKTFRKGALVKVNRKLYLEENQALENDPSPPEYIFDGPGEILLIKESFCQIRWRRPVPDVWLKSDLLEPWS